MAREMILGIGEKFSYVECGRCGTLQIGEIPADLERFYGPRYYSFKPPYRATAFRRWLKRRMASHRLGVRNPVGGAVAALLPTPKEIEWVRGAGLGRDASILDVGAGQGQVLLNLWDLGFRRLVGIDPFLVRDVHYSGGVSVLKQTIEDVEEAFDLVMFHHSLEHLPDPMAALVAARDRLRVGGCVLIRTPVASESWRVYGPNWVELDAPRHLHVFTIESLQDLARKVGLRLVRLAWDTTSFELLGSELYSRNIPLSGGNKGVFNSDELENFEQRARDLNESGHAGRAVLWFRAEETG